MNTPLDQATFNIVSHGLHAIAQEMGEKLVRAALFHDHSRSPRLFDRAARSGRQDRCTGAILPHPHELLWQGVRGIRSSFRFIADQTS